ncbi:MAG: VIT domain-containing protein, partial [Planctomycetota bacterium]
MLRKTLIAAGLVALTGALVAPDAAADGFIRIRRRPMQPRNVPLAVKWHKVDVKVKGQTATWHKVDVKVKGQTATTMIDQVFHNPNNRVLEGTYMFPLPENAAIDDFYLYINGKPVKAELLDREKARKIYDDIVRSQKDPALLEYVGREMFQASVFP